MVVTLGQQYNVGEKPIVTLNCTLTLWSQRGTKVNGYAMYACMYVVCMVTIIARLWINRVRLTILHVLS